MASHHAGAVVGIILVVSMTGIGAAAMIHERNHSEDAAPTPVVSTVAAPRVAVAATATPTPSGGAVGSTPLARVTAFYTAYSGANDPADKGAALDTYLTPALAASLGAMADSSTAVVCGPMMPDALKYSLADSGAGRARVAVAEQYSAGPAQRMVVEVGLADLRIDAITCP